jgi:Uma2 family endonuclease
MTLSSSAVSVIYPDSDGLPMSDNTEQFRWIVMIKENLEILFASTLDVFVAGDLLWYPIEGDNKTRIAPDVRFCWRISPEGQKPNLPQHFALI